MENNHITLEGIRYEVIKTLESDNWIYYYTSTEDKEIVVLCKNLTEEEAPIEVVDDREYPILINKFTKID